MWVARDVLLANRIASRAAGPKVSAIGGIAPADGFTTHGAAMDPRPLVVVSSPSVLASLGDVLLPELHGVNDLAGTVQPELLPIGRTPLGKSRGFRLPSSRSVLQQTAQRLSRCTGWQAGFKVTLAHAVTASKNLLLLGQHKGERQSCSSILRAAPHVSL